LSSNVTFAVSQTLSESSAFVASNVAFHETVVSEIDGVVLFVANGALLSVNGPAITVPSQVRLSYSVNVTVPAVPAGVTDAVSCGIHLCAVLTVVGCLTVKHSVADESELGGTPVVVEVNSPLKQYVPAASGLATVFTSADKIGIVVVSSTGMSEPTCVPPVEQTPFVSWAGVHRKNFRVPSHVDTPSTVMVAESLTAVPDVTPPSGMAEPSLASTGWVSVPEPHVPNEPRVKSFSVAVTAVDDRVSAKAVEKH
jgi:hypothetical protein